jgi:hypothetical protein
MPRFLDSSNEALNDTLRPKRKVMRNMVKTFVDENFPNLGTTEQVEAVYDGLSTNLTNLYTALADLVNSIIYTDARANVFQRSRRSITEYFSAIRGAMNKTDLLMNKYKTLNLLIPEQIENLQALTSSIVQKYAELKTAPTLAGPTTIQTSLFENEIAGISNLDVILQKLQGLLGSYRQVPAGSSVQGAIEALPIAPASAYGVKGAGYGGSLISSVGRMGAPFYPMSDGYTINTINYSQPARFY